MSHIRACHARVVLGTVQAENQNLRLREFIIAMTPIFQPQILKTSVKVKVLLL